MCEVYSRGDCRSSPSVKTIGYFFCSRRGIKTRIYRRPSRRGEMAYFKDLLPTPVISRQIEPILSHFFPPRAPYLSKIFFFQFFRSPPLLLLHPLLALRHRTHPIENIYNNNDKNNSLRSDSSTTRGTLTDYKYYAIIVIVIICLLRE